MKTDIIKVKSLTPIKAKSKKQMVLRAKANLHLEVEWALLTCPL